MINNKKIIIMTKLADYDKNYRRRDENILQYFLHDYICKKNIWGRIYSFIVSLIILFFYWFHEIIIKEVDVFSLNYKSVIIQNGVFIIIVLIVYSIIGTVKYTIEYKETEKRIKNYFVLINKLNKLDKESYNTKEASNLYYGADTNDTPNVN